MRAPRKKSTTEVWASRTMPLMVSSRPKRGKRTPKYLMAKAMKNQLLQFRKRLHKPKKSEKSPKKCNLIDTDT